MNIVNNLYIYIIKAPLFMGANITLLVRSRRLELPMTKSLVSEASAYTNSATTA